MLHLQSSPVGPLLQSSTASSGGRCTGGDAGCPCNWVKSWSSIAPECLLTVLPEVPGAWHHARFCSELEHDIIVGSLSWN
mmetsp:Transcript_92416/g.202368  ORF Transcript_92416/g.202368 Transcript_92416/m.202368 type:complete len:80 (-) Transcript_92416:146-385(-)